MILPLGMDLRLTGSNGPFPVRSVSSSIIASVKSMGKFCSHRNDCPDVVSLSSLKVVIS